MPGHVFNLDRPVPVVLRPHTGGVSSLLTAQEVAALLGVPVSWVYMQTRSGRVPTVKLGRYYRYRREAIEAWIVEQEEAA
jgi:excisionase family DNA binding protein